MDRGVQRQPENFTVRTDNPQRIRRIAPLALILLAFAPGAFAQGWLVGGAFGPVSQKDYEVGGPIATADDSDDGLRAFGGYLFSPMHGVIASYVDLGAPYYDGPAWGGFTDSLDAEGYDVSYIIGFGVGDRIRPFATIGFISWTQDVHYVDSSGVYDYADKGESLSFGIGSEIALGSAAGGAWGIHFEWQLFKDIGDKNNSGHEYDREMLSAGLDYRFGASD
jgi:hypothetical protein